MITEEEVNLWTKEKKGEVMSKIFDAAERDLSVNNGEIDPQEVDEMTSFINALRKRLKVI